MDDRPAVLPANRAVGAAENAAEWWPGCHAVWWMREREREKECVCVSFGASIFRTGRGLLQSG